MSASTTHEVRIRTRHLEQPEDVCRDIEKLPFVVEALPFEPVEAELDHTLGDTGPAIHVHIHGHGCEVR